MKIFIKTLKTKISLTSLEVAFQEDAEGATKISTLKISNPFSMIYLVDLWEVVKNPEEKIAILPKITLKILL